MGTPSHMQGSSGVPEHVNVGANRRPARRAGRTRRRARKGEWEQAYLDALARGHVKAFAARLAGVSERCVYKRSRDDPRFADREQLAYGRGTYALEEMALARVTDPIAPSDAMLIRILSARDRSSGRGVLQED